MYKKKIIKKKFHQAINRIDKKKAINSNYFSLLIIAESYNIFYSIKKYNDYCLDVAPHWFATDSYIKDNVEYRGPNLSQPINSCHAKCINKKSISTDFFYFYICFN